MGAGASSTQSGTHRANPSTNRKNVLHDLEAQVRDLHGRAQQDAARIRTLEAQVLELKSSQFSVKRHAVPNAVEMDSAIAAAMKRTDAVFMREVFERHASGTAKGKLSVTTLMSALREVEAPVLSCRHPSGSVALENDIFRRADADMSGLVDFFECGASTPLRLMYFYVC